MPFADALLPTLPAPNLPLSFSVVLFLRVREAGWVLAAAIEAADAPTFEMPVCVFGVELCPEEETLDSAVCFFVIGFFVVDAFEFALPRAAGFGTAGVRFNDV